MLVAILAMVLSPTPQEMDFEFLKKMVKGKIWRYDSQIWWEMELKMDKGLFWPAVTVKEVHEIEEKMKSRGYLGHHYNGNLVCFYHPGTRAK